MQTAAGYKKSVSSCSMVLAASVPDLPTGPYIAASTIQTILFHKSCIRYLE